MRRRQLHPSQNPTPPFSKKTTRKPTAITRNRRSPAMVETLAPASQRSSANPKKDQIFLSDQSLGMDQSSNLGQNLFPPISSFSPSSSSASARKQTLSKPRMIKSRKGASSKPRPEATRPDKLEEKLSGWNPFASAPRDSATDGSVFGSGDALSRNSSRRSTASSGLGAFVFGSGEGPDLSGNSSIGADEGRKLREERDGSNVGKSGGFGEGLGSGSGVFVFGSGAKTSQDSSANSSIGSEGREKLNVGKGGGFGEGTFVFGSSADKGSEKTKRSNRRGMSANRRGTSAGSGKCASGDFVSAGEFVFGSSLKESSDMTERLNSASGGFAASGGFVFGSSTKGSSEKLNTRETCGDNVNGYSGAAGVFVFGSSTERSSGLCKPSAPHSEVKEGKESKNGGFVFGKNVVNTLHDNSVKSKIGSDTENNVGAMPFKFTSQPGKQDQIGKRGGSGTSDEELKTTKQDASQSAKGTSGREQVDVDNGFVSGTSENVSKVESFVGSTLKFSFGAEQDLSSVMGSVPLPPFQATATPPFCSPPSGPSLQQVGDQFSFTSQPGGLEEKHMEFKASDYDASRLTNENVFSGSSQNFAFSAKRGESGGTKLKKKKGKSRQTAPNHQSFAKQFVPTEGGSQENPETEPTDGYSPMDYSPYREETTADRYSREASVVSDDSSRFVSRCASADTQRSISVEREEVLVSAEEKLGANRSSHINQGELHENGSKDHFPGCSSAASSCEGEKTFGYGKKSDMPKYENVVFGCDTRTATMKAETGSFDLKVEASAGESGFIFSSSVEDFGQSKFSFTPSSFVKGPSSAQKRNHRRKSKTKPGHDSLLSTQNASVTFPSPSPDIIPPTSTSMLSGSGQEQKDISFVSHNEDGSKTEKSKEPEASQDSTLPASRVAGVEACEKWRYRGNQAYSNGYLSKAEDYYTRGIDSVSLKEAVSSCIRPVTLCYSNRAATRMALGRMREAIDDCKMALSIDPNFLRAQVRAANCYLSLGEIEETLKAFKKCLQARDVNCNQKIITEASDGLQKAQQVADLTGQVAELLLKRTLNDASKALQIISEALFISPLSDNLMEMKAEALLTMRKYEEVIQFCEGTLDLAEKNSVVPEVDSQLKDVASSGLLRSSPATLWRWHLISKSYFYLGKLEEALELLQKHENVKSAVDKYGNRYSDSSTSLASTIHELLRLKAAGNIAFQAARHSEAVECYTAALVCNAESRPFAAVCFCNRAAAYQALCQIADAIADCSLAIALDTSYPKAISRRATLHEMIRDYGQAANDLQRLISVLEKRLEEKDNQNGASGRSLGYNNDLRKARMRLATMEEEARKGRSLDMYMILGIEPSSSAADIKKAYRKAALRHHPDKAGQFLVRNENVDDGLWREVANAVHTDADRLFKIIGESYTTLSDPTKRLQYDAEEEMRNNLKKGYNGPSTPRTPADSYNSYYERNTSRRQWRAYGSSSYQW